MHTRLSTQAIHDLQRISDHIAVDNPVRAVSFIEELRNVAKQIGAMPRAFPLIPRYERHGIRRRSYRGYGILYSAQPDQIFIHRIIGPGQDHDRALRLK